MRLTAAINLPVLLLALAVGSFALPKDTGQNPTPDCSSTFFLTALFFVQLVDSHRPRPRF